MIPDWWRKPRRISVVVDNDSWILPYCETLVAELSAAGDDARLLRDYGSVGDGGIAFLLGCVHIAPYGILRRNHRNLVVHESDLPRGRGFSPMTWQIIEGRNDITVCLFEAEGAADSGNIVLRDMLHFTGNELIGEMRNALGSLTVEMCRRYLDHAMPPTGIQQVGEGSAYRRRHPVDSMIDPHKSIAAQFDLLRTVDNNRYPAFLHHRGRRYFLKIEVEPDSAPPDAKDKSDQQPITGTHVELHAFRPEHVSNTYVEWMNDPEINCYLESRFQPQTLDGLRNWVAGIYDSPDEFLFRIILKKSGEHLGNIKLGPINRIHHFAPIGFLIGAKRHWGAGYASEAIELICRHAFENLGLNKIVAGCYCVNSASIRTFEKAGFVREGANIRQYLCDGAYCDAILFGRHADRRNDSPTTSVEAKP